MLTIRCTNEDGLSERIEPDISGFSRVQLSELIVALWRRTFIVWDEDQELIDPDKELGSDFIDEVIDAFRDADLVP